jgi:hypothetical protein
MLLLVQCLVPKSTVLAQLQWFLKAVLCNGTGLSLEHLSSQSHQPERGTQKEINSLIINLNSNLTLILPTK